MPAVARTPSPDETGASPTKKTGDELRRKLTGLDEVDEEEEAELSENTPHRERSVSCGSESSRRASIDTDGRKKKSSDASLILTEDTDSFIIGDKVWVGGTKPGQIAYIGETQFAPGEWAGVVLDEPVGKNDGSVAGIRYFQCELKRGVFSRLTRLTRKPLDQADCESPEPKVGSDTMSVKSSSSRRSPISPMGSTKDVTGKKLSTTSPNPPSGTSSSSLKIGDRVIVMSSMGSKAGVLRYKGPTDFAAGEWCGVELDDPVGKNDGAVGDRRYFECRPKFGLFAPAHKVSQSPSSRRPSSCMLHRSGIPASGIRRAGSRESISSMTSSIASSVRSTRVRLGVTSLGSSSQRSGSRTPVLTSARTPAKDSKDKELEKLLKERYLDRQELTRAASQADEAEQKLAVLKQQHEEFQRLSENRMKDLQEMLAQAQQEKSELLSQLEDEKKRVEDLLFQYEEASIAKSDIQVANTTLEETNRQLEQRLAEEQQKSEKLELESNQIFEREENITRLKDEVDNLRKDCDKLKIELCTKTKYVAQLEADNQEKCRQIEQLSKVVEDAQTSLKLSQESHSKLQSEFSSLQNVQVSGVALNSENEKLQENLKLKTEQLEHMESVLKETEVSLKRENEDLQKSLKLKTEELEQMQCALKELEGTVRDENENLKKSLKLKTKELEGVKSAFKTTEESLKVEYEELQNRLKLKSEAVESVRSSLEDRNSQVEELKKGLDEIRASLFLVCTSLGREMNNIHEEKETDSIKELVKIIEEQVKQSGAKYEHEMETKTNLVLKLEETIREKGQEITELRNALSAMKEDCSLQLEQIVVCRNSENEANIRKINEIETQVIERCSEVVQLKEVSDKLQSEVRNKETTIKTQQDEITILKEQLLNGEKKVDVLTQDIKTLESERDGLGRDLHIAEEKYDQLVEQQKNTEAYVSELMNTSSDSSTQLNKMHSELVEREKALSSAREQYVSLNLEAQNTRTKLQKLEEEHEKVKGDFDECNSTAKQLKENLAEEKAVNDKLNVELKRLEITIKETKELLESSEKFKQDYHLKEKEVSSMVEVQAEKLKVLQSNLEEKDVRLQQLDADLKRKTEQVDDFLRNQETLKQLHSEELESLTQKLKLNEHLISVKDAELTAVLKENNEIKKLSECLESDILEKDQKILSFDKEQKELKNENAVLRRAIQELEKVTKVTNEQMLNLEGERIALIKEIEDKNKKIQEATVNLENMKKSVQEDLLNNQGIVNQMANEISALKKSKDTTEISASKKEEEINILTKKVNTLQEQKDLVDSLLYENNIKVTTLLEQVTTLTDEKAGLEKISVERNDQIKLLMEEVAKLQDDFAKYKNDLEIRLAGTQKEAEAVQELQTSLEQEKKRIDDLLVQLGTTETERQQLWERCELLESTSREATEVASKNVALEKELIDLKDRVTKLSEENTELLRKQGSYSLVLGQKEKEEEKIKVELMLEKTQLKQYKAHVENLEDQMKRMMMGATSPPNSDGGSTVDQSFAQSEINFLNSVIVDQRKKIEGLRAHVELLERGITPSDAKELVTEGIVDRPVAPRVYCDICEVFDAHETEDCPQQATDSPPTHPKHKPGKQGTPAARPYCEICEVFGHDTADCDEEETF